MANDKRFARMSAGALCLARQLLANLFANPVENMQLVMHGCQASPGPASLYVDASSPHEAQAPQLGFKFLKCLLFWEVGRSIEAPMMRNSDSQHPLHLSVT
jgi:hypothetical protein